MNLVDDVRRLLDDAATVTDGEPRAAIEAARTRLDEPLRVAIAGKVKAGKSTLLNALVGEELAPTDAGECTRIVTWYRDGHTYRVELQTDEGERRQVPFARHDGALEVDLGPLEPSQVRRLDVMWPSSRLREMTLIDTPGIESISTSVSQRTIDFLTPDDERVNEADAVLYLMRHMHGSDVRFLESFHDDELAQPSPINAIGVLSRADEVGAARLDAMQSAARISDRYARDPKMRQLVQTVLPVAGLLAQAAATLSEDDFKAMHTLSSLPDDQRDALLLSADRFVREDDHTPVVAVIRAHLLDKFGLFGVRLGVRELVGSRSPTSTALAQHLLQQSGIDELRRVLVTQFSERTSLLKVRTALDMVASVAASIGGAVGDDLDERVERITAGAHELVEVRLLNQLRSGAVKLKAEELDRMERLISGGDGATRLGLEPSAGIGEVQAAAAAELERWRSRAESVMSSQPVRDASTVAVRTCEGIIARLFAPPPS